MQPEDQTLAPWAHPKAQEWIQLVLRKSDLIDALSDLTLQTHEPLSQAQQRMLSMLFVVLGHPGLLPEDKQPLLAKCTARLHALARQTREEAKLHAKTEDQLIATAVNQDWEIETEMLRRRGGLSKRVNVLNLPASWKRFWN